MHSTAGYPDDEYSSTGHHIGTPVARQTDRCDRNKTTARSHARDRPKLRDHVDDLITRLT